MNNHNKHCQAPMDEASVQNGEFPYIIHQMVIFRWIV